ncbi:MAG: aspartate aminotransferase family protein [Bacteroidota bacterium]|nr:aspartate aminotransferase family protein [Bacteroidota bacterium]
MKGKTFLDYGLADTTPHPLGLEVERASGVWIYTTDGRKVFDAIGGIGVSNFGHSNPQITDLLHAQIDKNLHTMVYGEFIGKSAVDAANMLSSILPKSLDSTYFTNSGAEAIEGALKLAKRATGRSKLIAFTGSYHGSTHGALSVSSNEERKTAFRPLLPGVEFLEWNCLDDLNKIDKNVAGVIVETIQGDAGVRIPSKDWLSKLRKICSKTGANLIFDEVQCGMGRTGQNFGFEHFNVIPDVLCLGKALGGGVPIGAFVSSSKLMSLLRDNPKLGHITTFGGNPLATTGAVGALKLLGKVNFDNIEKRGANWESKLKSHPSVKEVRRIGLFFYVELETPDLVSETVMNGLENGVLMFWFLSVPNAFRLSPPLNMTEVESQLGIDLILKSLPQ